MVRSWVTAIVWGTALTRRFPPRLRRRRSTGPWFGAGGGEGALTSKRSEAGVAREAAGIARLDEELGDAR